MKRVFSRIFYVLAGLLSHTMCVVVAYQYCNIHWGIKYAGYSAPVEVAFLYAIPFGVGIVVCLILAFFWERIRKNGLK